MAHFPRPLALAAVLLVALAPVATAKMVPTYYFLKDDANGTALSDGVLDPYDPALRNVPNGTQPHSRLVIAGQDAAFPVRFGTPAAHQHAERIKGLVFMGLWLGNSAVVHGNLTVTLFEVPASPASPVPGNPLGPAAKALAHATLRLDANPDNAPNATSLVPPQPNPVPPTPDPSDPQGSVNRTVAYEEGQAVAVAFYEAAKVMPILLRPAAVLNMGVVDVTLEKTSTLAIGFKMDAGSSPAGSPVAAFAQIQYDSLPSTQCLTCGPSYLFVAWSEPDPVVVPGPSTTTSGAHTQNGGTSASETSQEQTKKKSPGAGLAISLAGFAWTAFALRRKI